MLKEFAMRKALLLIILTLTLPLYAQKASDKAAQSGTYIPAGVLMPYAGSTAPSGWVLAYGQEVNQVDPIYKNLYAAVSTTYCTAAHGGACTSGKFRLPDLRGRVPAGKDNMGGSSANRLVTNVTGSTLGAASGNESFTPAGTNAPSNVPASGLGFSGNSTAYTVSVPAHYHGFGTSSGMSVDISHDHGSHGHTYSYRDGVTGAPAGTVAAQIQIGAGNDLASLTWNNPLGTAGVSLGATTKGVSGTVGLVAGGQNGNAAFSASGSNTPTGSVTGTATAAAQAFTGTAGNNLPPTVVTNWIIKL